MTENKSERTIICSSENCAWQEMTGENQSYWQFSPDNLTAQEIWHWQNFSLNKLLLTFEFEGQNIFYAHYQNLLGLSLTNKTNSEEKIEKQIIVDWLETKNNQFNLEIEASSEAELVWNFNHPLWNYLKSQQIKNQTLTYDWVIKIEATTSAKMIEEEIEEENEASSSNEINLENKTKNETIAQEVINNQTENTSEENEETKQSETKLSINESESENEEEIKTGKKQLISEDNKKTSGEIKKTATIIPTPQVLGATTVVETESRKNGQAIWSGIILSLLIFLTIFSWLKLKRKKKDNFTKVNLFQLPKLRRQKHRKGDAFRQDAQDQIDW